MSGGIISRLLDFRDNIFIFGQHLKIITMSLLNVYTTLKFRKEQCSLFMFLYNYVVSVTK